MNIWRMKLRAGTYGQDMWPQCQDRGIASITHGPIYDVDLSDLQRDDLEPAVKTSARVSVRRFAWDMRGGDVIYIGDSVKKAIIACGYITVEPGKRAYRYNDKNPIREPDKPKIPWRHEVPVQWDNDFVQFKYIDGAPRITVMHFDPAWAGNYEREKQQESGAARKSGDIGGAYQALLNESEYMRDTPASRKNILRLHSALSNRFRSWLEQEFGVKAMQEKRRIDLHFSHKRKSHLAELKICYGKNTRHAIREALGQIFEYNHYPEYVETNSWWLVLDCQPSENDCRFINNLRAKYGLPLSLAWPATKGFEAFPDIPF